MAIVLTLTTLAKCASAAVSSNRATTASASKIAKNTNNTDFYNWDTLRAFWLSQIHPDKELLRSL